MRFYKKERILVMSLMDLEHCGFTYDEFCGELFMNGIDDREAETPVMLIVDFVGGAVIFPDTKKETMDIMDSAHKQFENYIEKVGLKDDNEPVVP